MYNIEEIKNQIIQGNCLEILKQIPDNSVDMVLSSPPYWALRDYGMSEQLGQEKTFKEYILKLCDIFDECKRVLKNSGTCWVNLGDTYSGIKYGNTENNKNKRNVNSNFKKEELSLPSKSLCQIPSRFAIVMSKRGWILRNRIIWHKPNVMPQSVKDRFTVDYEDLFFFVKNQKYYFEQQKEAMVTKDLSRPRGSKGVIGKQNSGRRKQDNVGRSDYTGFNDRYVPLQDFKRNKRSVWSINTKPFKEAHFATYPPELIEIPIKAGCPINGIILDPFFGAGTTGLVSKQLHRNFIGIELNPEYIEIAKKRLAN